MFPDKIFTECIQYDDRGLKALAKSLHITQEDYPLVDYYAKNSFLNGDDVYEAAKSGLHLASITKDVLKSQRLENIFTEVMMRVGKRIFKKQKCFSGSYN